VQERGEREVRARRVTHDREGSGREALTITAAFDRNADLTPGDVVSVRGDASAVHLFDASSGLRLN
jgi:hypothetical protein